MNKNTLMAAVKATVILLALIAVFGYFVTKCDFFTNVGKVDAKITNVKCGSEETVVEYILWNFSSDRVDFYRVVITATDKLSGKETSYQVKENGGILGNARLEKRMIIGVFDCSRYDFRIAVYHF